MSDVSQGVADRVREVREGQKLSQEGLARKLGVSWQTVSRYERGESRISLERLYEIAAVLGVPAEEFLDGEAA